MNYAVRALTVCNGKLCAGGEFTTAGGVGASRIAAWDGSSWSALGSGLGGTSNPLVFALTVYDNQLIAGGWFTIAGGKGSAYLAQWTKGACSEPIITGDVNLSGTVTSADIIPLVEFVFKSGPPPLPCQAAGDANCSGTVNAVDIISIVNYIFKAGAPPCDVCGIIPGRWSCP